MSLFNSESNFKDIVNSLNCENCEDYKCFNIVLLRNELVMNNINQMNELCQLVHLNPQMIQECEEIIYALLIASFYFELSCVLSSLPGN